MHLKVYFRKREPIGTAYLILKTSKTLRFSKTGLIQPVPIPGDSEQQNPSILQNLQCEDPEKEFTEQSTKTQIDYE